MADGTSKSYLLQLAQTIHDITAEIVSNLTSEELSEPTLEIDSQNIPDAQPFTELRDCLNEATSELTYLINGPQTLARNSVLGLYDLTALQVAFEFNFFEAIPENGLLEIKKFAEIVGIDEDRVSRILKILATDRIFQEVEIDRGAGGKVSGWRHSARSLAFLREPGLRDAGRYQYVCKLLLYQIQIS